MTKTKTIQKGRRVLTPVELALEMAVISAYHFGFQNWGNKEDGTPHSSTHYLNTLHNGLKSLGAIGMAFTTQNRYVVIWDLFPDDPEYYALVGDGKGDLFAQPRDTITKAFVI